MGIYISILKAESVHRPKTEVSVTQQLAAPRHPKPARAAQPQHRR